MIEIKGLKELEDKLNNLKNLDKKTKPLMNTIGNVILNEIEDSFEKEASPFGDKWQALKPSTIKNKLKKGKSEKILHKDGYLAGKWIVDADEEGVSVSNNTKFKGFAYGFTHQFGSNNAFGKGIKIPARRFLPVDKNSKLLNRTQSTIKKIVINFIKNI